MVALRAKGALRESNVGRIQIRPYNNRTCMVHPMGTWHTIRRGRPWSARRNNPGRLTGTRELQL